MTRITFKSVPEYYRRESLGLKNNTVRKVEVEDVRFDILSDFEMEAITDLEIEIINTDTKESFVKRVTDVCKFDEYYIISWRDLK